MVWMLTLDENGKRNEKMLNRKFSEKMINRKEDKVLMGKNVNVRGLKSLVLLLAILFLTISSLMFISAAAYARTNPAYTQTTFFNPTGNIDFSQFLFSREMCGAGQDFILQVDPRGCSPSVVRSDLLEEQNVPIFCPIVATKLNPMIDVEAINRISFTFNPPTPKEVQGLAYVPARAALVAPGLQIDQPVLNNLGYVVIVLKRNPNESAMPNFVQGNLTATLRYDIKNAFGVGQALYYLPEINDEDWEERQVQYGFWRGKGYLRAENIDDDSATISVFSDRESYGLGKVGDKRKIASHNIKVGKTSPLIPMPGFNYCLGSMEVKLQGLESPGTTAKLTVNNDVFELKKGEKFLEEKCTVGEIEKYGIVQKVDIKCREDEGSNNPPLFINPKVNIEIPDTPKKEYSVGDFLYPYEKQEKDKDDNVVKKEARNVYLGFAETGKKSISQENLRAILVSVPAEGRSTDPDKNKLSQSEISTIADKAKGGFSVASVLAKIKTISSKWEIEEISYGEEKEVFGKKIKLGGFASPVDVDFPETAEGANLRDNYEKAMKDYEIVREDFSSDIYPKTGEDGRTLGEKALFNQIELAWKVNKKETASKLCKEFSETYPDSAQGAPTICDDILKLSSRENAVKDVLVNGRNYLIVFESVEEPSFEDYGVEIFISGSEGDFNGEKKLTHNEKIYVSENEFISLKDLENDNAVFDISGLNKDKSLKDTIKIKLGTYGEIKVAEDKKYRITLSKINLNKVAKVSISPNIHLTETRANFSFKIGIEKRGIQLTPEKTKEKIASVNKTLEKWRGINSRLGTVVQAGKAACLATGGFLTVKNFFSNLGGKGIARQKVMRDSGGWYEICKNAVDKETAAPNGKIYDDVDSCLLGNSDAINKAVDTVSEAMETQDSNFEDLQSPCKKKDGFLGEDIIDTNCVLKGYVNVDYKNELETNIQGKFNDNGKANSIRIGSEDVSIDKILTSVTPTTLFISQARNLQLNSRLLNQGGVVGETALAEIRKELTDIWVNSENERQKQGVVDTLTKIGFGNLGTTVYVGKDTITQGYNGEKTQKTIGELPQGVEATTVTYNNNLYFLQLERTTSDNYRIIEVYDQAGYKEDINIANEIKSKFVFKQYDSYENKFLNPEIRYFERDPYKGLPAIVPFDLQDGWYAAVKSVLPFGGAIKPYDDSGRVSSFWLCNVGQNGREEFNSGAGGDICEGINLGTGQPYNQFPGITDPNVASSLVKKAVEAIRVASVARERDPKVSSVPIYGQRIKVGKPAASIPDIQCQDFMSPVDCNLLFNVCDPVVCPSSRCDLGGTYPVEDVVQSGVVGGLLLCLPNFPEVKVPICLSAVHAGLESYLSVLDSYQQCLQTSLDTGQTVGVCDEINSVYMCDFFWRQGLPVANILIPKAIGSVLGQNVRGGGEYLGVQDAWQRAGDSAKYFSQFYAANSYKAFKARTSEDIGTEICKVWVSVKAPGGGGLLDALTKPDVPVQFYGRFDEIPLTTVTNPPVSQYKVFYHIFAGKDFPAYYQVYLKGEGGTFFQDTDIRRVVPGGTGFVPVGEYITKTTDFTAPSGYKQMCIVVNNQEECGFKQVTTDFGVNYLTEKFVAEQASQTDITSEAACISGTPSALALLTPNVQSAAEGLVNPSLYNRGITRICATDNPGLGTDTKTNTSKQRWQQVGYCGDTKVKCWLDRKSVEDTIKSTATEKDVLDEVAAKNALDELNKQTQTLTEEQFDILAKEIEGVKDADAEKLAMKKIDLINKNIGRVLFNHHKGYLTLLRANAYREIAKSIFDRVKAKELAAGQGAKPVTPTKPVGTFPEDAVIGTFWRDGAGVLWVKQADDFWGVASEETPKTKPPETQNELVEFIKQIEREKVQELNLIGKDYPIFEFQDPFRNNLYYTYSGNNWYFSEDKANWVPVQYAPIKNEQIKGLYPEGSEIIESVKIANDQNDKNAAFIKSLAGKSYSFGLQSLIQLTKPQTGPDPKLSTNNIEFSTDRTFRVDKKIKITLSESGKNSRTYETVYFRFLSSWQWDLGEENWVSASQYSIKKESILSDTTLTISDANTKNFLRSLDGKRELEGAVLIFAMDTESGTVPTTTPTTETEPTTSELKCTTTQECQKVLGDEIIKIAQQIKKEKGISDATVKQNTGVENFECLVLMLTMGESSIQQCKSIQIDQNPLYCNGNTNNVLGGDSGNSLGVMQINTLVHKNVDVADFEENVKYGTNLLVQNYNSFGKESRVYACNSETYNGWKAALRYYNGWTRTGTVDCTKGNTRYVDYILKDQRSKVEDLFDEICG